MRARAGMAANIALASGACLFALILAELFLPGLLELEKVTLIHDPLLGFKGRSRLTTIWKREMDGKPRIVRTNLYGFHDFERDPWKEPGVHRIVLLGDSFLEAYQVPIEENFSQRLGARLNERGRETGLRVDALNQGVHGYGLGVHYLYVRECLLDWNPDSVVLVLFLGNDLRDNFAPVAASTVPQFYMKDGLLHYSPVPEYNLKIWLRDNILARSTIMRLFWLHLVKESPRIKNLVRRMGMLSTPEDPPADDPAILEDMAAVAEWQLAEIARFLAQHEIPLVTYVIPDPFRVHTFVKEAGRNAALPESLAERVVLSSLKARGVPYIYPRDIFAERMAAGQIIYRNGVGHFSKSGHILSAELLEPLVWEHVQRR